MHVALSALDELWEKEQPLLLLGDWCILYDRADRVKGLDYERMPYPWNDRERLFSDYGYVNGLYEQWLGGLADALNRVHGTAYSLRYWRIVVGPWLSCYLQVLYERYVCLRTAMAQDGVDSTSILPDDVQIVPTHYRHFLQLVRGDVYNMVLYSQLVRRMGGIKYAVRGGVPVAPSDHAAVPARSVSRPLRHTIRRLIAPLTMRLARGNRVALLSAPLQFSDYLKLHVKLGQWPIGYVAHHAVSGRRPDRSLRSQLNFGTPTTVFERLVCDTLPHNIPLVYVEEFERTRRKAARILPRDPRVIVISSDLISDDFLKLWIAHQAERGARIVGVQGGGSYGCGKWLSFEDHEMSTVDTYYSWGWDDDRKRNVIPSVALGLLGKRQVRGKPTGKMLCVGNSCSRYSALLWSCPIGRQQLDYLDEQIRFVQQIKEVYKPLLVYRLYPHEYGWREDLRLTDAAPWLEVYRGPHSMVDQLRESRLCIGTYNSTTYLATLAWNYPTVLFWNPHHWELRPSAQSYFDDLRRVGILHGSPEAAAAQVNAIADDPMSWWSQPHVQEVRERFCRRFARTSEPWLEEWTANLKRFAEGPLNGHPADDRP